MGAARKLFVADLFCGAGGTSTGVALVCRELDKAVELLAINHWATAIETHRRNHPWATHVCANVEAVDPRKVVPGGRLDLLVASPECIWHSTARGGKPINDQARASAWRVLEWCERLHVSNVLIENVPEFRGWGPLGADDRPLKSKRGQIFYAFIEGLKAMNYNVEYRVLNAADYGAATSRRRLFILAKKGQRRLRWPQATHAKGGRIDMFGTLKPHRAAREIIDWSIPGVSIFTRKKSLARTTLLRIEAGLLRYGGPLAPLFVSALRAYMAGKQYGEPVEVDPTSPAGEAFLAILRGTDDRQVKASSQSCSEPVPALAAGGGHIAIVEPKTFITVLNHNNVPKSVDGPLPTVTGGNRLFLTEPQAFILPNRQFELNGADSIEKPLRTVMPTHVPALVDPKAFVLPQNGSNKPRSVEDPVPVITTTSRGIAIVDPLVVQTDQLGSSGKCVRSVDEPVPTLHTKANLMVVNPIVVGAGGPERAGKPQSIEEPLGTVLTRNHKMLVQPVIVQANHGGGTSGRVHSVEEPLTGITASRGHAIAVPVITKYYSNGDGKYGQSVEEPLGTVTTKQRFALAEPVVTRLGIDIRFRMFRTKELARAMGFEHYEFTGTIEEQTRQIGNAVEVNIAKALVKAILE